MGFVKCQQGENLLRYKIKSGQSASAKACVMVRNWLLIRFKLIKCCLMDNKWLEYQFLRSLLFCFGLGGVIAKSSDTADV